MLNPWKTNLTRPGEANASSVLKRRIKCRGMKRFNMPVPICCKIVDSNLIIKFVLGKVGLLKLVMFTHY
jgi:hypothetical protein